MKKFFTMFFKVTKYGLAFEVIIFFAALIFFVASAHAQDNYSRTPYYAGQPVLITGFYPNPVYQGSAGWNPEVRPNNPDGFIARVQGGMPILEAATYYTAQPSNGAVASPASVTAAEAMTGGAGSSTGVSVRSVAIGVGAASIAGAISKLGIGAVGGVVAVATARPVIAALVVLQVGELGYTYWQKLKSYGISVDAAGVPQYQAPTPAGTYNYKPVGLTQTAIGPTAACQIIGNTYLSGGGAVTVAQIVSQGTPAIPNYDCYFNGVGFSNYQYGQVMYISTNAPVVPPKVPATDTNVRDAHNNTVNDPAAVTDIINRCFQIGACGTQLPPSVYDGAGSPSVDLKSKFTELGSSLDALGNRIDTLSRNIVNIPAIPAGSPSGFTPTVTGKEERVTVTNATGTGVTTTPISVPAVAIVTNTNVGTDICAQHPDVEACSNVSHPEQVTDTPLPTKNINVSITPVSVGTGLAVCPAPLVLFIPYVNRTITIDGSVWLCQAASLMKPLNISLAWLSAGFIVIGGIRKNG